jgi:hypothetical protein
MHWRRGESNQFTDDQKVPDFVISANNSGNNATIAKKIT